MFSMSRRIRAPSPWSLQCGREISQIWWWLVVSRPRQKTVLASVAVFVHPLADRIAFKRRRDLRRPIASVGIDAAKIAQMVCVDVNGLHGDDELDWLIGDHHPRHARGKTKDLRISAQVA